MSGIERAGTSTAAFIGETERGPTQPTEVTSWQDFLDRFGGFVDGAPFNRRRCFLPYAVRGFFENGGRRLFIVRVTGRDPNAAPRLDDYVGTGTGGESGLGALAQIKEASLVAAPDDVLIDGLARALVETCERLRDRFAVVSEPHTMRNATLIHPMTDSSWGAVYYPWLRVPSDHTAGGSSLVPPAGHICGVYARVDAARGVHKSPAGEPVRGLAALTNPPLSHDVTRAEQEILNPRGVNVIRDFGPSRGVLVWGARTMSTDPESKYVSVRRLFVFLEQSIARGLQWVVFEPNVESTWLAVRQAVETFLTSVWRDGMIAGGRPKDAFFVRCDRRTMTQGDIDNGRLVCMVGVAPLRPAEFMILRIGIDTARR